MPPGYFFFFFFFDLQTQQRANNEEVKFKRILTSWWARTCFFRSEKWSWFFFDDINVCCGSPITNDVKAMCIYVNINNAAAAICVQCSLLFTFGLIRYITMLSWYAVTLCVYVLCKCHDVLLLFEWFRVLYQFCYSLHVLFRERICYCTSRLDDKWEFLRKALTSHSS